MRKGSTEKKKKKNKALTQRVTCTVDYYDSSPGMIKRKMYLSRNISPSFFSFFFADHRLPSFYYISKTQGVLHFRSRPNKESATLHACAHNDLLSIRLKF